MTMTDQEQKELRSYSALLLEKFGFNIPPSDPILPPLYILHKETELGIQSNKELARLIQEALSKMNPKEFRFYNEEAAWSFQKGITIRWGVIGSLIVLLVWAAVWYWTMTNDVDKAKRIVEVAEPIKELLNRATTDNSGRHFIDFTLKTEGPIQPFKEFVKIDNTTVRIYLEKEPSHPNSKKQ